MKESPISDNAFPQYYKCSFMSTFSNDQFKFYESVRVQYSAYCPCSAALTHEGKFGYPQVVEKASIPSTALLLQFELTKLEESPNLNDKLENKTSHFFKEEL